MPDGLQVRTLSLLLVSTLATGVGCGGGSAAAPSGNPPATGAEGCSGAGPAVAIVVDPALAGGVRAGLSTFEADLCREGYAVVESVAAHASPPDLRRYLARVHGETQGRLQGAILVGHHPRAYQWGPSRHNLAVVLSLGASLGEGLLEHVNVPRIAPWASSREFHFATSVVLGDAAIKLRP